MLLDHKRKNNNGNFQTHFFENELREQIKKISYPLWDSKN